MKILKFIQKHSFLLLLSIIAVGTVFLAAFPGQSIIPDVFFASGEKELYYRVYSEISQGNVVFKDFFIEYPPFAPYLMTFPAMLIKNLTIDQFATIYVATLGVWLIGFLIIAKRLLKNLEIPENKINLSLWLTCASLALIIYVAYGRYDILPAIISALGILLFLNYVKTPSKKVYLILSVVLVTLGFCIKIYPIVVLPLFALYELYSKRYKSILIALAIFGFIVSLNGIFYSIGKENFKKFLDYQGNRDLQVESTHANVWFLAEKVGLAPQPQIQLQNGALEIYNQEAKDIAKYVLPLTGVILAGSYLIYWNTLKKQLKENIQGHIQTLVSFSFATIIIFLIFNKVFSPQYMVWIYMLIPLLAIKFPEKKSWLYGSFIFGFIMSAIITTQIYPFHYGSLLRRNIFSVVLLTVRNGILLLMLAYFLFESTKFVKLLSQYLQKKKENL